MRHFPSRCRHRLALTCVLVAGAAAGCKKGTEVESGAVLLELSVAGGVTTPDELQISVYADSGVLWHDQRVPASGPLVPESATTLGTVLIQPGSERGALRIHARGLAASARVADGLLTISSGSRGRFALQLDGTVPADGDGDGVPDAIDDCPAVDNPSQMGCPGTNDAGDGGDAGGGRDAGGDDVAPTDGGGIDAFNCDASGACDRAIGSTCTDGAQCHSSFCVDGVCCANACIGPCRSCNQPNNDGMCLAYAQGSDPASECTGGATCNGAGACGPPTVGQKPNGQLCSSTSECTSGFCKDGVCCNAACDSACKTCETGTCVNVSRKPDPPECYGTMTCNAGGKCVVQ
jgi:hypothetical protein